MRQTFNDSLQAREWEEKVIRRIDAVKSDRWLNKSPGKAIPPRYGMENNNFGKDFINNTLGKNFKYNQFDYDTQNNKFGENCIDNVFGKGFKNNEIADYFYNNTFSLNSMNNKFLLDNISNVNFGTKVARRLDIGYSDIEVIKTVTLGVLDLALE